jgi:hypothetical protein
MMKMRKKSTCRIATPVSDCHKSTAGTMLLPMISGILLGITAKLVDVPYITCDYPVFDDMMGRFGIWVWAAALIAVRSRTPFHAAVRSFVFFVGMLSAYYGYTVLFLKFFPGSQMVLWGGIAMITPFCGFLMWHIHKNTSYADLIASLPFVLFFTEWYLTAFTAQNWSYKDRLLLFIAYLCMTLSLAAAIPTNKRRIFSLFYAMLLSVVLIWLIQAGIMVNFYDQLLNV